MVFGIIKAFLANKVDETSKIKLAYYLQIPFRDKSTRYVFLLSSIAYFIFFGFVANIFILFNNDGTVFTLLPSLSNSNSNEHDHSLNSISNSEDSQPIKAIQSEDLNLRAPHQDHLVVNNVSTNNNQESNDFTGNQISYPSYRLIICCNNFGYVPMLTLYVNSNISVLLIPLNLFVGIIISILVGLNISYNVFMIKRLKITHKNFSKGNFLSGIGFSTGFLVGCPTCAGSLLYTLIGFSSLITFSSLSLYQMFFIVTSIPALIISLLVLAKLSRKSLCEFPGLN
jgi:hypothetical protein